METLHIHNLSKSFGSHRVIDDISFAVPAHSVFGFIGQNGAGKTTTMKMILGLLKADSGSISICGENVKFGQTNTNKYVGYLPDVPAFYGYMRPKEYLALCGEATGMAGAKIKARSQELLSLVGLAQVNKKISSFSRGMKQRLGIAQALLGEPQLLICDEPTSALDPIGRKEILDILGQVGSKTTVIFSTHILSDVERICDRIAVLDKGKLVLQGTLQELKARRKADSLLLEFSSPQEKDRFAALPQMQPLLAKAKQNGSSITLHVQDMGKTEGLVLDLLGQNKILPVKLEVLEPTIENLFLEVVK